MMESNECSAFYLPTGLTDEEEDPTPAAPSPAPAGPRRTRTTPATGPFSSVWSTPAAVGHHTLSDSQLWSVASPPQTPPTDATPKLTAWSLTPSTWKPASVVSNQAWALPAPNSSPAPTSPKASHRTNNGPRDASSMSPIGCTTSSSQSINQWFSPENSHVSGPMNSANLHKSDRNLPRSLQTKKELPVTSKSHIKRRDVIDWEATEHGSVSPSTSLSTSTGPEPTLVLQTAAVDPSTSQNQNSPQRLPTAHQPQRPKQVTLNNQSIPGLDIEETTSTKSAKSARRRNTKDRRAKAKGAALESQVRNPIVSESSDNLVDFATERAEETRKKWKSTMDAAKAMNDNQVQRSRAAPTANHPNGSVDAGHSGTSRGRKRRAPRGGQQTVQQGSRSQAAALPLAKTNKGARKHTWLSVGPTPSRDAVHGAIEVAHTRVLDVMKWVLATVFASAGMLFDFIRAVFGVVKRLHRHAFSCLLSDSQVAFCMVFTYCFPLVEWLCNKLFPPWAARCLWYGFLVQNGFFSGGGEASDILLLLLFLMDGLTYTSTITDLAGTERLIIGYFLAAARLGASRKRLCLLSGSTQVVIWLAMGTNPGSQWLIGLLSASTLPVPPLVFQDADDSRSGMCIMIRNS